MHYQAEREEVAFFIRRIYERHLTSISGGNVSRRADGDAFAITASAIDKGLITADEICVIRMDGENLTPNLKPSSEYLMHLRIYERLPEVKAIVHAHPLTLGAFVCSDTPLRIDYLGETYALLEEPVTAPYALSSTDELAEIVAECATRSSCILMRNHAVTTTGATLTQAFGRLELMEEAAKVTLLARFLDNMRPLDATQKAGLDALMGRG